MKLAIIILSILTAIVAAQGDTGGDPAPKPRDPKIEPQEWSVI